VSSEQPGIRISADHEKRQAPDRIGLPGNGYEHEIILVGWAKEVALPTGKRSFVARVGRTAPSSNRSAAQQLT